MRLTFTNLRDVHPAENYPWRAGMKAFRLYVNSNVESLDFEPGKLATPIGNYRDYSDIPRWVGAWAGWFWPRLTQPWIKYHSAGTPVDYSMDQENGALPTGRTWGHFQWTGTAGKVATDIFDKQPLMDVISYVREVTGFSFWIDEAGGMVFRLPNLFRLGNWVSTHHLENTRQPQYSDSVDDIVVIDEDETLLSYRVRLSSKNIRERVFIAESSGKKGVVVKGYNPNGGTGLMRIAGWTDSNWKSKREMRIAADLIVARQAFDWRRASMRIPGNPAIQVDDQIRIYERTTQESHYHYVVSVSSNIDMETGVWEYNLETHWLGSSPNSEGEWAVTTQELSKVTREYLDTIGAVD